jgi:hypothetical protein
MVGILVVFVIVAALGAGVKAQAFGEEIAHVAGTYQDVTGDCSMYYSDRRNVARGHYNKIKCNVARGH